MSQVYFVKEVVNVIQCECSEWMTYSNKFCAFCMHKNPHYIPIRVRWGERGYSKKYCIHSVLAKRTDKLNCHICLSKEILKPEYQKPGRPWSISQ